ncbi:YqiA/YcfP family alpha/beta fold hydrolase [Nonlabens antarcticus]|uniref:YqiA/YcfP family alpha/beta fold hydrolase n=1 Tax=Nonlabens antarcticus TaxID=392714 RepID=UPI001E2F2E66|nr:YqiA/YcfP family alpha/beta fold hydrolase [Nonlabens antarcticus]
MTILYLHGLMSRNISDKIDWLKEAHAVFHPLLNYENNSENIFSDLKKICEETKVDLIIGSSMGGHLGYHLSNLFKIPSLLFNPSLERNNIRKPPVEMVSNESILHTIVLGVHDDVVIPSQTINYLKSKEANFIHTFEENGHRTPFIIFKKHFEILQSR